MKKKIMVHVIPSFHYDVAYVKTFKEYLPMSLDNIKEAMKLLDKNHDYTYCVEQVVLLREYWKKYPEDRAKMKKYASAGRFFCAPGMFTMPDSNIPSGENFIRNSLIGRNWLKENLGITPTCCWMADIFGHNPQSPQLARTCGFESYMFERGKAGSWKTTFNWKGIDGTMIPALWEVDTYYGVNLGLAWTSCRPQDWIDRRIEEQIITPLQNGSPCKDVLITPLGGDFLKPTKIQVDFIHNWNKRNKNILLRFSSPEAYFRELKKKGVVLPVEKNDLNPLCEGCNSSRIRIKQFNRRLEEMAATLEALETMARSSHSSSEDAWETLAFNAFHDIICGSLVKKAAQEALDKYQKAEESAKSRINSLLSSLTKGGSRTNSQKAHVFFNSLPYPRKDIVQLTSETGAKKDKPVFREINLPPLGFAMADDRKIPAGNDAVKIKSNGFGIENKFLRITFGQSGTIASLFDKEHGVELSSDSGMNNPIMQSDTGDMWTINGKINSSLLRTAPFYSPRPTSGSIIAREGRVSANCADADCYEWPQPEIICNDPLQATVQFSYPQINIKTQVSLRKGERLVRIKTFFMATGKRYRMLVAFPTSIKKGRIRHSVPCGHMERPEGEYGVQGWIDYADKEKGVLLLNKGLPGNNVTGDIMMLSLLRAVSMENQEKEPWYEEGIEHVFEYGIMPFSMKDKNYNPAREAALFNREICQLPAIACDQGILKKNPVVELKGDGAELTCLKRENSGLLLRLWESRGQKSRVSCVLDRKIGSCFRMDATGTNRKTQNFKDNVIELSLKPFEIITLFVK